MKLTVFFAVTALQSAFAEASSCPFAGWKPPGEDDVRGPCPMLNTLANHGFLPHDGKEITREVTTDALGKALNVESEFAGSLHDFACTTNLRKPNATTFSLSDLSNHNILEHDASLSRQDFYFGNVQPFNQKVFDQTRSFWTAPIVDIQMGANALVARQATSEATNPTFNLSEIGTIFAYAETAAYIIVLGDKIEGTVERSRVEYLFENERLPTELGWDTPESLITEDDLIDAYQRVIDATGRPNGTVPVDARMAKPRGFHAGRL